MSAEPKPSIDVTYRRADGEPIEEFGWVSGTEWLDEYEAPIELVEERWERVEVRRFWHVPTQIYSCDAEGCDEDAVAWEQQPDGKWMEVCEMHRAEAAPSGDSL